MIPAAVRRGDYAFTSTLDGSSRSGGLVDSTAQQLQHAFGKLPAALASAGATMDEVTHVSVSLGDWADEPLVDVAWRAAFPRGGPACRVTQMVMAPGHRAHVQAGAVRGRRLYVTPSIDGRGRDGRLPADPRDEIAQALANVCAAVEAAGGTSGDLVHFWAFAADGITAVDFTRSWVERFPVAGDRPARKTFLRAPLRGPERVTFQATALIGGGRRTNYEVPGVRHRDPLPMGARVGDLFMSSGILPNAPDPNDPDGLGPLGDTLEAQLRCAFATLERLLRDQGGSLRNIGLLGVLVNSFDYLPHVQRAILERFAPGDVPALQVWSLAMASPQQMLQLFATAVF